MDQHDVVDTFELARSGARLAGERPVPAMARLATLLADTDARLRWELRGWREARPEGGADDFMELRLEGDVRMPCARCNGPVAVEVGVERAFRVVRSEAEADRLDLDDPQFDVIAGGRRFDLAGLIEDEAIMALPAIPRHDDCALPAGGSAARTSDGEAEGEGGGETDGEAGSEPARPSPFAALASLKNGRQKPDIIED